MRVQIDEDQTVVDLQIRCRQEGLPFCEALVAAVGLPVERQTGEPSVVAIGPTVVGAAEIGGVAHFRAAYLHTAMQAHIKQGPYLSARIAGDDERIVENPAHDVVALLWDL